jgi:hypothetical protein
MLEVPLFAYSFFGLSFPLLLNVHTKQIGGQNDITGGEKNLTLAELFDFQARMAGISAILS